MKFRPLGDRVVVRRVKEEQKTAGGIIIPETAQEKPQEGEVISVGPGALDEHGKRVVPEVKAGDFVLFGKWSGTEVKVDGEDLLIMKESDIMGVLDGRKPVSGKKALYLDPTTTIGIVGMPQDEADALLDEVAAFATQPQFVYDHHWQVGDVLLWSNGFLLHKREPFPSTERRLMKRATMVLPKAAHIVPEGELAMAA